MPIKYVISQVYDLVEEMDNTPTMLNAKNSTCCTEA